MKRYQDLNTYLREIFGQRVQKIPIDAGFGCPNRDGTISDKGCIYCDSRGSGTGALIERGIPVKEQVRMGRDYLSKRYKAKKFIVYFQAFTNTHAPVDMLREIYDQALCFDDIVGISIGTRPDCVDEEKLRLIASYRNRYMVWIEYGLQSAHDETLRKINRGHDVKCFEQAVHMTERFGIRVCAHVILGLPEENRDMMLETARFISSLPVHGVKIHMLYVVEGTPLSEMYKKGEFRCLAIEEYVELVVDFLELLRPDIVIQRLTGDPLKRELIAPLWAMQKGKVLNMIQKRLEQRDTWQGRSYTAGR